MTDIKYFPHPVGGSFVSRPARSPHEREAKIILGSLCKYIGDAWFVLNPLHNIRVLTKPLSDHLTGMIVKWIAKKPKTTAKGLMWFQTRAVKNVLRMIGMMKITMIILEVYVFNG